jgi:tetratricopeptide (TPR) repeat protein
LAYDINETKDLLARALASNPANPWALHSLAYVRRTKADWSGSEELERKAFNTTQNDDFQQSLQYDLIAENKTKDLEVELLDKLKSQPMNVTLNENLMQCYSKEGNFSAVLDTQKRAVEALQKIPDKDLATKPLLINSLNVSADYYTHNFAQLEQDTISSEQPWVHFLALVGEKKWDAIRANPIPDLDTYSALLASTAARADGQIDLAESLFTNCLNALKAKGDEQKLLLSVLQSPTPPSQADLDNINQECQVKEVILTTLAYLHPEAKQDFCAAAHQFHVVPTIGYYIVDPLLK